jgi:hypothetical protein
MICVRGRCETSSHTPPRGVPRLDVRVGLAHRADRWPRRPSGSGCAGPVSAVVVTVLAFALILWIHSGDRTTRFQDAVLLVGYWIPAFVAVVVIDWVLRVRGRATINPAEETTGRADAVAAVIAFVLAYAAAIPFMNTTLIGGPIAKAWHGADIAYFVNLLVAPASTAATGCWPRAYGLPTTDYGLPRVRSPPVTAKLSWSGRTGSHQHKKPHLGGSP